MSKSLFRNTLYVSISTFIPLAVNFLILPFYTKVLGVEGYGVLNSMQVFSSILIILFPILLDKSLYRLFHDFEAEFEKRDFLGTIFISILFLLCLLIPILFLFNKLLGNLFPGILFYPIIALVIANSAFSVIINYYLVILQVRIAMKQFVVMSLINFLLPLSLSALFVFIYRKGATGYFTGIFISFLIFVPYVILKIIKEVNISFNKAKLFAALRYCLPLLPYMLSTWILGMSDRILIGKFYSQYEIGIYSLGYKIASIIALVSTAFFTAYNPLFYDIANSKNIELRNEKIKKINSLFLILLFIFSSFILCSSDWIINFFFISKFHASIRYTKFFCMSIVLSQLQSLFILMLTQAKKTSSLSIILIVGAVSNFSLNFLLIPRYGVIFSVFDSIISNLIILLLLIRSARNGFYVGLDWHLLSFTIMYYGGMILIEYSFLGGPIKYIFNFIFTFIYLTIVFLKYKMFIIEIFQKIISLLPLRYIASLRCLFYK